MSPRELATVRLAGSIFLCYRRDDSADISGRIYDWLTREFPGGRVFKDVDSIPFGVDFRDHLKSALRGCRVVLVVIGRDWLEMRDLSGSRRLDDPGDYVRVEVETALQRRPEVTVIPVLVGGASLPGADNLPGTLRDLAYIHTPQLRRDPDFVTDMSRLMARLKTLMETPAEEAAEALQKATANGGAVAVTTREKETDKSGEEEHSPPRVTVKAAVAPTARPVVVENGALKAALGAIAGALLWAGIGTLFCMIDLNSGSSAVRSSADVYCGTGAGLVWGAILGGCRAKRPKKNFRAALIGLLAGGITGALMGISIRSCWSSAFFIGTVFSAIGFFTALPTPGDGDRNAR